MAFKLFSIILFLSFSLSVFSANDASVIEPTDTIEKSLSVRNLVNVNLNDQRSCEKLVNKARNRKLAILGGSTLGSVATYFAIQKVIDAKLRQMAQQQKNLQTLLNEAQNALKYQNKPAGGRVYQIIKSNLKSLVAPKDLEIMVQKYAEAAKEVGLSTEQSKRLTDLAKEISKRIPRLTELMNKNFDIDSKISLAERKMLENEFLEMGARSNEIAHLIKGASAPLEAESKKLASEVAKLAVQSQKNLTRQTLVQLGGRVIRFLASDLVMAFSLWTSDMDSIGDSTMTGYIINKFVSDKTLFDKNTSVKLICENVFLDPSAKEALKHKLAVVFTSKEEDSEAVLDSKFDQSQ